MHAKKGVVTSVVQIRNGCRLKFPDESKSCLHRFNNRIRDHSEGIVGGVFGLDLRGYTQSARVLDPSVCEW